MEKQSKSKKKAPKVKAHISWLSLEIKNQEFIMREIERIKVKFIFKSNYNLLDSIINEIPGELEYRGYIQTEIRRSFPRSSEIHKQVKKFKNPFSKLLTLLQETPEIIKNRVNSNLKNTPNNANDITFKQYTTASQSMFDAIVKLGNETPKDTGAQNNLESLNKLIIEMLFSTLYNGTGALPECTDTRKDQDKYNGNFYYFVQEMVPILKILNFKLLKKSTLGKYTHTTVLEYNHAIQYQIEESLI